jgi:hypothetical protein
MALLICEDCEGEVSDKAPSCPHCGARVAATENAERPAAEAEAAAGDPNIEQAAPDQETPPDQAPDAQTEEAPGSSLNKPLDPAALLLLYLS